MSAPNAEPAPDPDAGTPWRRLSLRMLLVDPLGSLTKLLPVFLVSLWIGSDRHEYWFETGLVTLVVVIGALRWISTSYRVGETHIVLRKGFFNRQVVTVARDRIRSVDTESDLFHRLMRVSIVEVGTGQSESGKDSAGRFRLHAIATSEVEPLRDELLGHLRLDSDALAAEGVAGGSRYGEDLARLRLSWARFAPFSLLGVGTLFSLWLFTLPMGDFHDSVMRLPVVTATERFCDSLGRPWDFVGRVIAVWLVTAVLAVIAYCFRFGRYALTDHGSVIYVQNGVFRRKHQALDKARLRGVEMWVPVFLRVFGGGRLEPIMTGTKRGNTGSTLLPQAPLSDVRRVATRIVGDPAPVTVPLRRHPRRAVYRRITRGLFPFYLVAAIALLIRWDRGPGVDVWLYWGLPFAFVFFVALSIDRIRMLGHALLPGHLVTSHGSWTAKRAILEDDGIIAWTVTQTPFQARAGVASSIAATPAGDGSYQILDIDAREAWTLAEAITPGITDVWGRQVPRAERVSPVGGSPLRSGDGAAEDRDPRG